MGARAADGEDKARGDGERAGRRVTEGGGTRVVDPHSQVERPGEPAPPGRSSFRRPRWRVVPLRYRC